MPEMRRTDDRRNLRQLWISYETVYKDYSTGEERKVSGPERFQKNGM